MLLIGGYSSARTAGSVVRIPKIVDLKFSFSVDNSGYVDFKDAQGKQFARYTIPTDSGKTLSTFSLPWQSGTTCYLHSEIWDTAPPVTASNPCGLYLYDEYNKKLPIIHDAPYCQNIRKASGWYNGPAWFAATGDYSRGRYKWVFKVEVPVIYE